MTEHELKTWPQYYADLVKGIKTHETRFNDRGFKVGDILILREYEPEKDHYTGRQVARKVIRISAPGDVGLLPGYITMDIVKVR